MISRGDEWGWTENQFLNWISPGYVLLPRCKWTLTWALVGEEENVYEIPPLAWHGHRKLSAWGIKMVIRKDYAIATTFVNGRDHHKFRMPDAPPLSSGLPCITWNQFYLPQQAGRRMVSAQHSDVVGDALPSSSFTCLLNKPFPTTLSEKRMGPYPRMVKKWKNWISGILFTVLYIIATIGLIKSQLTT